LDEGHSALRGYDAVQLASASTSQESVGAEITLATFDRQLWEAGKQVGIQVWPETLKDWLTASPSIAAATSDGRSSARRSAWLIRDTSSCHAAI
jgi:hypothetical protein